MKNTRKKGFTIVELVIVIVVIAILAAVLIPTFSSVINSANDSKALQQARNAWVDYCANNAESFSKFTGYIKVTLSDGDHWFKIDNGQFPSKEETNAPTSGDYFAIGSTDTTLPSSTSKFS